MKILLFGITKDIVGANNYDAGLKQDCSVGELREHLYHRFPQLRQLRSLLIAVNSEYADDKRLIVANDEVALIPPVSGG